MIVENIDQLVEIRASLKEQWKKVVFTNGCFDILHPGHLKTFQDAKSYGDVLIVALNDDRSPYRSNKPGRPINDASFRSAMLDALRDVDYVISFDQETPLEYIKQLQPDVLVKWGDYKAEDVVGYEFITQYWGKVVIIPTLETYATTGIINKILAIYKTDGK